MTEAESMREYDLELEDIRAALAYAAQLVDTEIVQPLSLPSV